MDGRLLNYLLQVAVYSSPGLRNIVHEMSMLCLWLLCRSTKSMAIDQVEAETMLLFRSKGHRHQRKIDTSQQICNSWRIKKKGHRHQSAVTSGLKEYWKQMPMPAQGQVNVGFTALGHGQLLMQLNASVRISGVNCNVFLGWYCCSPKLISLLTGGMLAGLDLFLCLHFLLHTASLQVILNDSRAWRRLIKRVTHWLFQVPSFQIFFLKIQNIPKDTITSP